MEFIYIKERIKMEEKQEDLEELKEDEAETSEDQAELQEDTSASEDATPEIGLNDIHTVLNEVKQLLASINTSTMNTEQTSETSLDEESVTPKEDPDPEPFNFF